MTRARTAARPRAGGFLWITVLGALTAACLALPGRPAAAFPNTQPDAAEQWYLTQDRAWAAWPTQPTLATVKVAVIDSGIDAGNPAFAGQIAGGRSFVGGSWRVDTDGHGTFVAGIIAATSTNGIGTAGIAFNAKLLVAKVVDSAGVIPPSAEAAAIRWAADQGAGVINLSFGGQRDPNDPELDSYLAGERAAIEYAYARGSVVVAAVGNGTNAPTQPWDFADWPAALPNVLGVAALNRDGSVPRFSNRDPLYVDVAAPGSGIFSTIPRNLVVSTTPGCSQNPYSNCGPSEFQLGNGTSFAAPQAAAAAALLLGVDPNLSPDQVIWLIERSATDMNPSDGCSACPVGRDALTGWGRLDIARAVSFLRDHTPLPPPDLFEPDDDAAGEAHPLTTLPLSLTTSEDFWDDAIDVFSLRLTRGELLSASVFPPAHVAMKLRLWRPGTVQVETAPAGSLAASGASFGAGQVLRYRLPSAGVYYLEVLDTTPTRERAVYRLAVTVSPPAG